MGNLYRLSKVLRIVLAALKNAVSSDTVRPMLCRMHYDKEKGILQAADGFIVVSMRDKYAELPDEIISGEYEIKLGQLNHQPYGMLVPYVPHGSETYPDLLSVYKGVNKHTRPVHLLVNMQLFKRATAGAEKVLMTFHLDEHDNVTSPVELQFSLGEVETHSLLMPMMYDPKYGGISYAKAWRVPC